MELRKDGSAANYPTGMGKRIAFPVLIFANVRIETI